MEIIYEDNHIIAVNKTCNEIVQGDKTGDTPLSDLVKAYIKDKYNKPGDVFLGVTHRIDRPTSGVVLFARTGKALERLNRMFQNHSDSSLVEGSIHKTYWAITADAPTAEQGVLENKLVRCEKQNKTYIARPNDKDAKQAVLTYRIIAHSDRYHLWEINLLTGRHHQIRCQLASVGCPIKGDLKYGAKRSNPDGGISLHARQVEFIHPVSKEHITITASVPNDTLWKTFESIVNKQK